MGAQRPTANLGYVVTETKKGEMRSTRVVLEGIATIATFATLGCSK
jgi:hypothetical protein